MVLVSDRITVDPLQCGGRPCLRGMRIRVSDVLDLLAAGLSAEQVVAELPDLEPADVAACLHFAGAHTSRPAAASVSSGGTRSGSDGVDAAAGPPNKHGA